MYFIYLRFQGSVYLVTPTEEGVGFTEQEASTVLETLVRHDTLVLDVTHEPSGDRFQIGIPAAAMKDVMFFAKEKKAE